MKQCFEHCIPRVGILGGTFNPVHFAHLRLAACVAEALDLERVELMPCNVPPHKPAAGLLPFELRCDLLEAAVQNQPRLAVSRLEGALPPPSYTWNLIAAWKEHHNGDVPLFILGAEDFAQVKTWHRGNELAQITSFLTVPRGRADEASFRRTVAELAPGTSITAWHESGPEQACTACSADEGFFPEEKGDMLGAALSKSTIALFLPLPLLDISASAVRIKWMRGDTIRSLTPDPVLEQLENHAEEIRTCWSVFV